MSTLPKELNYTSKLQALPSSTRTISCVISPNNGTTFASGGDIAQFDMGQRGFLVPGSLHLRYVNTVVQATNASEMRGTPAYTAFQRCETFMGGNLVESINDYNQVCNMIVNCKLNHAQKVGLAYALGYLDKTTTPSYANLNGCAVPVATTAFKFAMPLNCILSNCENLFPLCLAPAIRIQFTTDSLLAMIEPGATACTSSTLSRLELCYDIVEFGPEVEQVVRSMADSEGNLIVKSQSWASSTLNLPAASSGSIELTFNQRISSIKSIFASLSTVALVNRKFSSKDVTAGLGTYQFSIGGEQYPQRPIDATNKAGCMIELLQAFHSNAGHIDSYNVAITPLEFSRVDNAADTVLIPGKFWLGTNVERLCGSAILTGVSSQLSPISLRISAPTATTDNHNVALITLYDALIALNVNTRQASVKT